MDTLSGHKSEDELGCENRRSNVSLERLSRILLQDHVIYHLCKIANQRSDFLLVPTFKVSLILLD